MRDSTRVHKTSKWRATCHTRSRQHVLLSAFANIVPAPAGSAGTTAAFVVVAASWAGKETTGSTLLGPCSAGVALSRQKPKNGGFKRHKPFAGGIQSQGATLNDCDLYTCKVVCRPLEIGLCSLTQDRPGLRELQFSVHHTAACLQHKRVP